MSASGRNFFLRLVGVLGLLAFGLMVWRIGPGVVWSELGRLSPASLVLIFGMRAAYWLLRTWIWRTVYARYGTPPPFGHLFAARLAGHAVSYLTPSAYVGGEAVRALMIEGHDRKKALASIIVDTTFEVLAVGVLAAGGVIAVVAGSRLAFPSRAALAGSFAAAALVLGWIVHKQRNGLGDWLACLPGRLGLRLRVIERNRERIRRVDTHIGEFYALKSGGPVRVFALDGLLNVFWIAELFVTLNALGAPGLTVAKSILVCAFGSIGLVLPLTPASFGTYEATSLAVFAGLGWSAGLAMSMILVRRALSLFWAGVGLIFIARKHIRLGPAPETWNDAEEETSVRPRVQVPDRSE
jgi:uncharacterized protein (TIRG00374 family)